MKNKKSNMSNMVNYTAHSYIIPVVADNGYGVFIQDVNGNLWKTEEWKGFIEPNAIAVISKEAKFLIALRQSSKCLSYSQYTRFETYMSRITSEAAAKADYNGARNTANILKIHPSTDFAACYCDAFVFPDGKTKGYLPSLGQLNLAHKSKDKIEAALRKCCGTAMECYYWSSTFGGMSRFNCRHCWRFCWDTGSVFKDGVNKCHYVRPFANLQ